MNRILTLAVLFVPLALLAQPGTLDPSFDSDGILITDLSAADDEVHAVVVQPDGRTIVVVV